MQTAPAGTAGVSGFIALENGLLYRSGNSGAFMIGSGLAAIDRGGVDYVTVGSGDSGS